MAYILMKEILDGSADVISMEPVHVYTSLSDAQAHMEYLNKTGDRYTSYCVILCELD